MQKAILIATLVAMLGGCASVTRGVDENVTFNSVPPGATMRSVYDTHCGACMVDSQATAVGENEPPPVEGPACITPCSITVPRNKVLIATFTKEGYEPETVNVRWKVPPTGAAGFVGNALIGGVIGLAIDAGTGAALDHSPNPATAIMRPIAKPAPYIEPKKRRPVTSSVKRHSTEAVQN